MYKTLSVHFRIVFFYSSRHHRDLHSFPTRRSSDLRVWAWILILNHSGVLNWSLQAFGVPPANVAYTDVAVWIVFSYIWLPFMIIPTYAALERVPESLVEAASDLGARRGRTLRDVALPLALPG